MVNQVGGTYVPPVQLSGLVSGLDITSIINQLMAVERQPLTLLQQQHDAAQAQYGALGNLEQRLTSLQSLAQTLATASTMSAKKATSDTPTTLTAAADSTAAAGTFQVTVKQLATATTVTSSTAVGTAIDPTGLLQNANMATAVTAGTFTVNGVSISVDPTVDSLNAVISRINASGANVTASLVNDPDGRLNRLQITSNNSTTVNLGGGGDTSNFLTATGLLNTAPGTTRTSVGNLGVALSGVALQSADLATALSTTSGSFSINGVTISWDATQDSLNDIIGKINASSAGVTASYDALNDRVTLVAKQTGATQVALQDASGNFLAAAGLTSATQSLGQNARYSVSTVNGGADLYSTSNTVTGVVPGVTLSLLSATNTPVNVTVSADVDSIVSDVQQFVSQYNSVVGLIDQQTFMNTDPASTTPNGPLAGDLSLEMIKERMRSTVGGAAIGTTGQYTALSQVGITFGAVGTAAGQANTLQVDETALRNALSTDPTAVAQLFSGLQLGATLQTGGTGSIASVSVAPTGLQRPGVYSIASDASGNLTATFTPDDGSAPFTVSGTIAAGGTNATLIPGVTLTAQSTLQAGTDTLSIPATQEGIMPMLTGYLNGYVMSGGILGTRQTGAQDTVNDLNDQIQQMQDSLTQKAQQLKDKFAAMEDALARLKQVQSMLQTTFGNVGPLPGL